MVKRADLTGRVFERLTVLGLDQVGVGKRLWRCRCLCGASVVVCTSKLVGGGKRSCGCLQKDVARSLAMTHGKSRTIEHKVWDDMKARCSNPNATGYRDYGGRGIKVCERWAGSFESFLEDMGPRPDGFSLDRIDVDGDYEPGNCRWASWKAQQRNKRTTRLETVEGLTASVAEHCERLGLRYGTVLWRLRAGWCTERAFGDKYRAKLKQLKKENE